MNLAEAADQPIRSILELLALVRFSRPARTWVSLHTPAAILDDVNILLLDRSFSRRKRTMAFVCAVGRSGSRGA